MTLISSSSTATLTSTSTVITGLERILQEQELAATIKGNIGYLCHSASVTRQYEWGIFPLKNLFGKRLRKLIGPQHGLLCNVQDNMVETQDFFHPYFQMEVHSLYSHVRKPTDEMLQGLDTILVDLQDVGTRVYTYFSTLSLLMEACAEKGIEVVVLDRPNPIGGEKIEGNLLSAGFTSFVGRYPMPQRHAMTMGELALWVKKYHLPDCQLRVVSMLNWKRSLCFSETQLPWVWPSPNLPTLEGAYTYVGTVLFEGTNISEGRGTTRSLEIVGHPKLEPFSFLDHLKSRLRVFPLEGFVLRPINFVPTFQKHQGVACGGYQIHVTDKKRFSSWHLGQFLCQEFYHGLEGEFEWKQPPYEYEFDRLPIDLINGTDKIRHWVERKGYIGSWDELLLLENEGKEEFLQKRENVLIYS